MAYEVVIGLEIHVQLATRSKIFSADDTRFGALPNHHLSWVTLGLPGTLPVLNREAVTLALRMALACGCTISRLQYFDRKNYFYPDLPKGYQLTQDRTPLGRGGAILVRQGHELQGITLNRIHLEEDAGKLIHSQEELSCVDFNRAGVPLIEMVTEPVLRSAEEAGATVAAVRQLVRFLGIGDGNMEEGSLRCDANVSLRLPGSERLGTKVEIKNLNSVRHLIRAIEAEVERQSARLQRGEVILSETRLFDADSGMTRAMRTKEELNDYRYFPDPDISALEISDEWLREVQSSMPRLPHAWYQRFLDVYGLPAYDAAVLTDSLPMATYFEEAARHTGQYKALSNWLMGPVKTWLNEKGVEVSHFPIAPHRLPEIIDLVGQGLLSFAVAAQKVLPVWIEEPHESPRVLAARLNVVQQTDQALLLPVVEQIVREFPLKVEEYHKGKKAIVTMFMGEVMKRTKGKAEPQLAQQLIVAALQSRKPAPPES